jgi:hypothetical protein
MAGLRTSPTPFQWFAATLPTALIPTPPAWQKNASKPLRTTLLRKRPARFVSTEAHGTKIRCVVAPHRALHFRGGGLGCSLSSPMFSLMGEGRFEWIRGALGVFLSAHFLYPQKYPQSDVVGVICADGWGRVPMNGGKWLPVGWVPDSAVKTNEFSHLSPPNQIPRLGITSC